MVFTSPNRLANTIGIRAREGPIKGRQSLASKSACANRVSSSRDVQQSRLTNDLIPGPRRALLVHRRDGRGG